MQQKVKSGRIWGHADYANMKLSLQFLIVQVHLMMNRVGNCGCQHQVKYPEVWAPLPPPSGRNWKSKTWKEWKAYKVITSQVFSHLIFQYYTPRLNETLYWLLLKPYRTITIASSTTSLSRAWKLAIIKSD